MGANFPRDTVYNALRRVWTTTAANGYIVVAPNRRGLPGFERAGNDAVSGEWAGQQMRDYLTALDKISEEPYVDKDRRGCSTALRASLPLRSGRTWPTAPRIRPAATSPI